MLKELFLYIILRINYVETININKKICYSTDFTENNVQTNQCSKALFLCFFVSHCTLFFNMEYSKPLRNSSYFCKSFFAIECQEVEKDYYLFSCHKWFLYKYCSELIWWLDVIFFWIWGAGHFWPFCKTSYMP